MTTPDVSYSEVQDEIPMDWHAFLNGNPSDEEWEHAAQLAGRWVTCACGRQCAVLPRNEVGEPEDSDLYLLGNDFFDAINKRAVLKAQRILGQIEARSALLLAEMGPEFVANRLADLGYNPDGTAQ